MSKGLGKRGCTKEEGRREKGNGEEKRESEE